MVGEFYLSLLSCCDESEILLLHHLPSIHRIKTASVETDGIQDVATKVSGLRKQIL